MSRLITIERTDRLNSIFFNGNDVSLQETDIYTPLTVPISLCLREAILVPGRWNKNDKKRKKSCGKNIKGNQKQGDGIRV